MVGTASTACTALCVAALAGAYTPFYGSTAGSTATARTASARDAAGAVVSRVVPGEAIVDTGRLAGAAYRVEIPRGWTGGLVLYAHGHQVRGAPPAPLDPRLPPLRELLLARGFAVGHSDYRVQGWAVAEGIEDTEALRRYVVACYGRPSSTFVMGHSMGGHIAIATIER